jgi:hypothetical protein
MSTQLVTAFSTNDDGRQLVLLGLTDDMIAKIKKDGGVLQTAERNGQGTDVAVLYAPELNELVAKLKKATSKVDVHFI